MPNLDINLGSFNLSCLEKVCVPLMVCSHERSGTHFMMNSISKCTEYTASPFLNYDYLPLGSVVNFFSEQSIRNFLNSIKFMQNTRSAESWNKVFQAYLAHPEIIGGENRTDTNIIINSERKLIAKLGAEGVLFVTDNSESLIFNCADGSKRGVDLAATYFLYSNGWINKKPFEYLDSMYTSNRQNTRAVEIEIV